MSASFSLSIDRTEDLLTAGAVMLEALAALHADTVEAYGGRRSEYEQSPSWQTTMSAFERLKGLGALSRETFLEVADPPEDVVKTS